jgi:prepilin-type N-terminal cleavage/methylation domain-containing protein
MLSEFTKRRRRERGFSLLEMMLATVILLVGLVAVAQLVPASILLNYRNRNDSTAMVFAQRELDQMLDQALNSNSFTDALGNACQLGNSASPTSTTPTVFFGSAVVVINNQALIDFNAGALSGYNFLYQDPTSAIDTKYEVRWAVILTGNGTTVFAKRFILGVRQQGGNGYFPPITLDTIKAKE